MTLKRLAGCAAAVLIVSLSACQDQPTSSTPAAEVPPVPKVLAELRCSADVQAGTLSCQNEAGSVSPGGASQNLMTVGGQHHYVRLAGSVPAVDATAGTFTTTVTVQNLLLAALGTADGETPHASGVRVFFVSGPTNGVTVANATGQAVFLNSNADYFQYSGGELGFDGILIPDETSAGKEWTFNTNGASTFAFSVYVQAQVPAGVDYTAHFTQIAPGSGQTCALTEAGKAYCWGNDEAGRLGNGDAVVAHQGVPFPVAMPAGVSFTSITTRRSHTCALGSNGRAYCWASDFFGQLGDGGTNTDRAAPVQVQMPAGVSFTRITAGDGYTCALASDDLAYCWGSDTYGQLGNGSTLTAHQATPSPVQMPARVSFTSIEAGSNHTCALGSDSRAYCWGSDQAGKLGNGSTLTAIQASPSPVQMPHEESFSSIEAGGGHTCALGSYRRAYCWGSDANGQLGNGSTAGDHASPVQVQVPAGVTFSSLSPGTAHTCALGSDGSAYCWGVDAFGQLGNGSTLIYTQHSPSPVQMPAGVSFSSIVAADATTCALTAGPAYCWGRSLSRNVGDGTAIDRFAPVVVAGTR